MAYNKNSSFGGRDGEYDGGFRGGRGGGSSGNGGSRCDFKEKLPKVNFNKANLQPLTKNFYHEHASVTRRSQAEVDQWVAANNVTLDGNDIPRPVFEFIEGNFPESMENLLHFHYQKPTVIQSISWPVALSGRDLVAIAQTGSGKTLGFIIPAIIHTLNQPKRAYGEGPSVVVLLPTRELAQQVEEVARDYCKAMKLSLICCYDGASKGPQAGELKRGVDVVVATPGRLNDFLQTNTTNMGRCSYLVLDEANRMLDMGFEPQIRQIVGQIRPDRQTLMFSATWPKEVRSLAEDFQSDAVFLNVGSMDLSANHNKKQKKSELITPAKNISPQEREEKRKTEIDALVSIITQLNVRTENLSMENLFGQLKSKIQLQLSQLQSQPDVLLKVGLSEDEWRQFEEYSKLMNVDFAKRADLLLKRLDLTINSFMWSDRIKKMEPQIMEIYKPGRESIVYSSNVYIEDIMAATAGHASSGSGGFRGSPSYGGGYGYGPGDPYRGYSGYVGRGGRGGGRDGGPGVKFKNDGMGSKLSPVDAKKFQGNKSINTRDRHDNASTGRGGGSREKGNGGSVEKRKMGGGRGASAPKRGYDSGYGGGAGIPYGGGGVY